MSLARRAFTVSSWTFLSRLLGLVRDRLWAGIGDGLMRDAFFGAFALPNMLRELFGDGALSQAFIPRYVQLKERDPAEAERFAGAVLGRLALLLSGIALLMLLIASGVAALGASKQALVAILAIPMLPYLVFICLVALMSGMLNGRRRFWVPAAMPVVLNVVMISTVWLSPDQEIQVMPYAVLGAGILQVGLTMLALKLTGGIPPLSFRATPEERDLRRAIMPVVVAASVYQINALIGQYLALFWLSSGAVSCLYFGNRLLQFPLALIGHGVSTAAYPEIASRATQGFPALGEGLREAVRLLSFWLLPAAVGLLATAEPLVRTIYQTGSFDDPEKLARTVLVTRMLALALVPLSLQKLLLRGFHAARDQRTPMQVSLAMVALNFVLSVALILTPLQEAGLALATALSSLVGCLTYAVLLHQRGTGPLLRLTTMLRPAFAAAVMGTSVCLLLWWWPQPAGRASGYAAVRLGTAVVLGMAVYLLIAGRTWLRPRTKPS